MRVMYAGMGAPFLICDQIDPLPNGQSLCRFLLAFVVQLQPFQIKESAFFHPWADAVSMAFFKRPSSSFRKFSFVCQHFSGTRCCDGSWGYEAGVLEKGTGIRIARNLLTHRDFSIS